NGAADSWAVLRAAAAARQRFREPLAGPGLDPDRALSGLVLQRASGDGAAGAAARRGEGFFRGLVLSRIALSLPRLRARAEERAARQGAGFHGRSAGPPVGGR